MIDVYCPDTQQEWPFTVLVVTKAPLSSRRVQAVETPNGDIENATNTASKSNDQSNALQLTRKLLENDIILKVSGPWQADLCLIGSMPLARAASRSMCLPCLCVIEIATGQLRYPSEMRVAGLTRRSCCLGSPTARASSAEGHTADCKRRCKTSSRLRCSLSSKSAGAVRGIHCNDVCQSVALTRILYAFAVYFLPNFCCGYVCNCAINPAADIRPFGVWECRNWHLQAGAWPRLRIALSSRRVYARIRTTSTSSPPVLATKVSCLLPLD